MPVSDPLNRKLRRCWHGLLTWIKNAERMECNGGLDKSKKWQSIETFHDSEDII